MGGGTLAGSAALAICTPAGGVERLRAHTGGDTPVQIGSNGTVRVQARHISPVL